MMFQRKVDRAMKLSAEKAAARAGEYDPKKGVEERELKDELEKGDLPAMLISALVVIVPICLVLLVLLCLIAFIPLF